MTMDDNGIQECNSSPISPMASIPVLVITNNEKSVDSPKRISDPCEGGTAEPAPEEGRQKRRKCRASTKESECPVCGVTLRTGEINTHLALEISKLVRLPQSRPLSQRTPLLSSASSINVDEAGPSSSSSWSEPVSSNSGTSKLRERLQRKGTDWPKYERIRSSRQSRSRQKRRRGDTPDDVNEDGMIGGRECPVCDKPFPASEIQRHIERCLRQAETEFEDDEVDVEGDEDGEEYEEYEWCGVTRVRATTLLRAEGQLHAIGTKVERGSEDEMVDVCDDEGQSFGPSQYTDGDLVNSDGKDGGSSHHSDGDIPNHQDHQGSDLPHSQPSHGHLYSPRSTSTHNDDEANQLDSFGTQSSSSGVVSSGNAHNATASSSPEDFGASSSSQAERDRCDFSGPSQSGSSGSAHRSNPSQNTTNMSSDDVLKTCCGIGGGGGAVMEALRARVRDLEEDRNRGRYTCRVCHGEYEKPIVSVSCWHVHCETCWLQALAAKKLCPQCSVITTTSDLRRVYL